MKLVYCLKSESKKGEGPGRWSSGCSAERGAALVICVLILTASTILGLVGIQAGVVDLQIATNHTQMERGFYLAEGAALEGVQRLANSKIISLQDRSHLWHHRRSALEAAGLDLRCTTHWSDNGHNKIMALESSLGPDVRLAAVEWGLAAGSSMVVTESRLYLNRVYGRSARFQADHLVEIGFQMRY